MSGVLRTCLQRVPSLLACRSFHVTPGNHVSPLEKFREIMRKPDGYQKYGLLRDDLESDYNKDVVEAVRRLPEEEQMKRIYRAMVAQQYDCNKSILPEDQWTTDKDNHNYLQPYLKEVIAEREEREEWEATH